MKVDLTDIISMILVFLLIVLFAGTPDLSDAISDKIKADIELTRAQTELLKHTNKEIK